MPEQALSWQTYAHAAVSCHFPSALQLCRLVLSHCIPPGAHTPVQPFSPQTVEQRALAFHAPLSVQVETMFPSHFTSPGLQIPVQAPLVQRYGQVASDCNM